MQDCSVHFPKHVNNSVLTPKGHEDGEEDGGRVVEQIAGSGRPTGGAQLPVAAGFVT